MTNDNMTPAVAGSHPLQLEMVEGEPLIPDIHLAVRLGFMGPLGIRRLIARHAGLLAELGVLVTKTAGNSGGRPGKAYYLNRKQAIFITAKSETPKATEITIEIVDRFDAYERNAHPALDPNDPRQLRTLLISYSERVEQVESQLAIASPKATAYDEFIHRHGEVTIDEVAKMLLGWSALRLYQRLRDAGWVDRRDGINTPRLWVIQQGLMVVRPTTLYDGRVYSQPKFTPKGIAALRLAIRGSDLFMPAMPVGLLPAPASSSAGSPPSK